MWKDPNLVLVKDLKSGEKFTTKNKVSEVTTVWMKTDEYTPLVEHSYRCVVVEGNVGHLAHWREQTEVLRVK